MATTVTARFEDMRTAQEAVRALAEGGFQLDSVQTIQNASQGGTDGVTVVAALTEDQATRARFILDGIAARVSGNGGTNAGPVVGGYFEERHEDSESTAEKSHRSASAGLAPEPAIRRSSGFGDSVYEGTTSGAHEGTREGGYFPDGMGASADSGSSTGASSGSFHGSLKADYSDPGAEDHLGATEESGPTSTWREYNHYLDDFQRDYEAYHARFGHGYERYEPAYRYGYDLAYIEQYAGREWEAVEADVERDWEQRNLGAPWHQAKDAVRHAWERVRADIESALEGKG